MEINQGGLPIHARRDRSRSARASSSKATGSSNCSPAARRRSTFSSGDTIPITQTSDPVQLDQVLDALNTDTRANLQTFLIEYGSGLTRKPNAAEDAAQEPEVRGLNGAQALNRSYHPGAHGAARRRGHQPGVRGHRTARPLQARRRDRQGDLGAERPRAAARRTDRKLQHLLRLLRRPEHEPAARRSPSCPWRSARSAAASPRSSASFAPTRAFALAIVPGVRATPATVTALLPWIEQVQASLQPSELGGVAEGPRRGDALAGEARGRTGAGLQADRPVQQMPDERDLPGAATRSSRTDASTSGVERLQGVLVLRWWVSRASARASTATAPSRSSWSGSGGQTLRSQPRRDPRRQSQKGCGCWPTRRYAPLGTRPAYPARRARHTSRSCPATRRPCPNFNGPLVAGARGRDRLSR